MLVQHVHCSLLNGHHAVAQMTFPFLCVFVWGEAGDFVLSLSLRFFGRERHRPSRFLSHGSERKVRVCVLFHLWYKRSSEGCVSIPCSLSGSAHLLGFFILHPPSLLDAPPHLSVLHSPVFRCVFSVRSVSPTRWAATSTPLLAATHASVRHTDRLALWTTCHC